MNVRGKTPPKSIRYIGLGLVTAWLTVASSLNAQETQSIKIDGSSTVYPITFRF